MFYRRKIVFALLEKFNGSIERTRLQKLLFLLSKNQSEPNYEFVPYKYGCYSFSLRADLDAMVKKGWLSLSDRNYQSNTDKKYYNSLTVSDRKLINETKERYGEMSIDRLIIHTYINFPYHAINSEIAENLIPEKYYNNILDSKPSARSSVLFTIGYEGISLEAYLNKLVQNNIGLLVDVRRNPLSMKYGFSKTLLQRFCNNLGIDYIHIPEVGVDSSKRRELNSQEDYDILFEDYKKTVLLETQVNQNGIVKLLKKYKRIALTCFEADKCQCHRTHLAENLKVLPSAKYSIHHL